MHIDQKNNLNIGEKIKKLRTDKKLSMRELGEKVGVSHAHISKLESGINSPSVELLEKIAQYFDIDVSYFFIPVEEENRFMDGEQGILRESVLTPESLKKKEYNLVIDGNPATDDEIEEMIKYVKAYRLMKKMEGS